MRLFFREIMEICIFHLLKFKFDVCLGIAVDEKSKRKCVTNPYKNRNNWNWWHPLPFLTACKLHLDLNKCSMC